MTTSILSLTTTRDIDAVAAAIESAAVEEGFGVLGNLNLNEIMAKKGVECSYQARVVEVCQPNIAVGMLEMDPNVAGAMPCRIGVYAKDGVTTLTTIAATMLLSMFEADGGESAAQEVEDTINRIMQKAAQGDA